MNYDIFEQQWGWCTNMGIENWDELLDYCSEEFRKEVVLTRYYSAMWKRNQERPGWAELSDKEFSEAIMHQRERLREREALKQHFSEDYGEDYDELAQPDAENTNELAQPDAHASENTNEIAQPAAEGRNSGGGEN